MSQEIDREIDEEEHAVDRTMRAIVLLAANAIESIEGLGWRRKGINMEISGSDPLPCWVTLRKKRVFEIKLVKGDDGKVTLQGEWIEQIIPPTAIEKLMGR